MASWEIGSVGRVDAYPDRLGDGLDILLGRGGIYGWINSRTGSMTGKESHGQEEEKETVTV